MKIVKCKKDGHLFNVEKYDSCPMCGTLWGSTEPEESSDKSSLDDNHKSEIPNIRNISLDNELNSQSREDNGKNINAKSKNKIEPIHTMAFGFKENFPVALLIAIKGIHKGEIFEIYPGQTTVGRGDDMLVCLANDETVSRNVHCLMVYGEDKKFYVKPGQSRGMTYINKEVLFSTKEVKDRQIVSLGKTKLMVLLICNDEFSWEEEK